MKLELRSTLAIFASAIVFSGTVAAQKNYRSSNDYIDGVTVYEHCDFKGKSITLREGEYRSLRDVGIGNDSVSSIRVPYGNEAVIYQDDDFRGSYARIDQDIRCFDRQWNDEASSLSVRRVVDNKASSGQRYEQNRYNSQANGDQRYDNNKSANNGNKRYRNNANVTAKNIAKVVFDGQSLQQISKKEWSLDRARGASTQFDEVRRDTDVVYLQNKYTAERVRIDLFSNDVTFVNRAGRQQRYLISDKAAALGSVGNANNGYAAPSANVPNRSINSNCFDFKAYTRGGSASLRFHGKKELYRFNKKASTGRICHQGALTMEMGKTKPGTDVTIEISGNRYRFAAGEKEDKYLNNWYRKSIKLSVGR